LNGRRTLRIKLAINQRVFEKAYQTGEANETARGLAPLTTLSRPSTSTPKDRLARRAYPCSCRNAHLRPPYLHNCQYRRRISAFHSLEPFCGCWLSQCKCKGRIRGSHDPFGPSLTSALARLHRSSRPQRFSSCWRVAPRTHHRPLNSTACIACICITRLLDRLCALGV